MIQINQYQKLNEINKLHGVSNYIQALELEEWLNKKKDIHISITDYGTFRALRDSFKSEFKEYNHV